jgi:hypothetical protein
VDVKAMAVVTMKQGETERRAGDHNEQQQNGKNPLHGMNLAWERRLRQRSFQANPKRKQDSSPHLWSASGVHWNQDDSFGWFPAPQPQALLF